MSWSSVGKEHGDRYLGRGWVEMEDINAMAVEREGPDSVKDRTTGRRLRIAIVDENPSVGRALARKLEATHIATSVADDVHMARRLIHSEQFDAVIVGIEDEEGCLLLESLARLPDPPEVLLHLHSLTSPVGLWSRREGYGETLEKPAPVQLFSDWLHRLAGERFVAQDSGTVRLVEFGIGRLLGRDPSVQAVRQQVQRVASFAGMPVLIMGPTGTGKELIARAIHEHSCPEHPFVTINCAAIPEQLFENELFGHSAGAFTQAQGRRAGLLEEAGLGTVFLDEVGELPDSLQPKLLRVLETRRFRPVGSNREVPLRARVVSATNATLHEGTNTFRSDLYYRLAGFTIRSPSLRERHQDIALLARHFVRSFCEVYDRPALAITQDALELLEGQRWPGNIRELRGVLETAVVRAGGNSNIDAALLSSVLAPTTPTSVRPPALAAASQSSTLDEPRGPGPLIGEGRPFRSLPELERFAIVTAYQEARGNLSAAARTLGIPRSTLRDRLRRFGIPELKD